MQTLTFNQSVNLSLLHDQLIGDVPGFHRTESGPYGDSATMDCGRVEGTASQVTIAFADDIDAAVIRQVVAAHDPTKTQPDPRRERLARIAEINAIPRAAWTADQRDELSQLLGLELTQQLGRL